MQTFTAIAHNLTTMTMDELRASYHPDFTGEDNRELARLWRVEVIRRNPGIGALKADELLRGV
jgi:hypothetical protein